MQVRQNSIYVLMSTLCLAILLSGCLKNVENTPAKPMAYFSVLNLASTGPSTELYFNNEKASNPFTLGAYTERYTEIKPGAFSMTFKKASSDSVVATIPAQIYDSLNFYSVVTYSMPDLSVGASVIKDDYTVLTGDKAFYRFWHLSLAVDMDVDLYINTDKKQSSRYYADNIMGSSYNNQLTGITAGTYNLYVKKAGTDSTIATTSATFLNGGAYTIFLKGTPGSSNNNLSLNVLTASK